MKKHQLEKSQDCEVATTREGYIMILREHSTERGVEGQDTLDQFKRMVGAVFNDILGG